VSDLQDAVAAYECVDAGAEPCPKGGNDVTIDAFWSRTGHAGADGAIDD